MNKWDILIIVILAAVFAFVLFLMIRRKKQGKSCCGDCSACQGAGRAESEVRQDAGRTDPDGCCKKERK